MHLRRHRFQLPSQGQMLRQQLLLVLADDLHQLGQVSLLPCQLGLTLLHPAQGQHFFRHPGHPFPLPLDDLQGGGLLRLLGP